MFIDEKVKIWCKDCPVYITGDCTLKILMECLTTSNPNSLIQEEVEGE